MPPSKSRIVLLLTSVFVAGATLGCAGKASNMVRTRAATDFSCPAESIELTELTSSITIYEYTATGCEQSNQYQAQCGQFFFMCKVKSFAEIDKHNAEVEDWERRTYGCKSDAHCVEKYGEGFECYDYGCIKDGKYPE